MADKKDVLDYLRNQQKAAEIEAKINGVNVWVLLGAMAVVAWQLSASIDGRVWREPELALRTMVAAVGLHMLSLFVGKSNAVRDDLRYSRSVFVYIESPFLVLVSGLLIALPPAALVLLTGKSLGSIALGLFGIAFVVFSVVAILKPLLPSSPQMAKFPKPEFGPTKRADLLTDLIFCALLVVAIAEQTQWAIQAGVSLAEARQIGLLAVLYLLVLIAVGRRQQNDGIAWTYELETELVVESITPEVAIRRIENRRLGPRLQDVVDRFLDDLDKRFAALVGMLSECEDKVRSAKQVPDEYPAERAARVEEAADKVSVQIEALIADCAEFKRYLAKLEEKSIGDRRAILAPVLASLKLRHESYDESARAAKSQLKRLLP